MKGLHSVLAVLAACCLLFTGLSFCENSPPTKNVNNDITTLISKLKNKDSQIRINAVLALAKKGASAVDPLIKALNDKDQAVRRKVIKVLGDLGDPRALQPLVKHLTDKNPRIRYETIAALGNIGDSRAFQHLIKRLNDRNLRVRKKAAETLDKFVDVRVLKPLVQSLRNEDFHMRKEAVLALGKMGTPATEPLITALGDIEEEIRILTVNALSKIGTPAVQMLLQALIGQNKRVSAGAAAALGKIGDALAVEPLVENLNDPNAALRKAVSEALIKLGPVSVEPLIGELDSDDIKVKELAIVALGRIRDQRAAKPLVGLLKDENKSIRNNVLIALESLNWRPQAREEQMYYLIAKEKWQELGNLGAFAIKPFIEKLQSDDEEERIRAAWILGKIGSPRTVEPLIKALQDENAKVRANSAIALGLINDMKALDPLLNSLDDESDAAQLGIVKGISLIGTPAVEPLIAALSSLKPTVRIGAAKALGEIADPMAIKPLINLMRDKNIQVRRNTASAFIMLGKLGEPALINALSDETSSVRKQAADILDNLGWIPNTKEEGISYLIARQAWSQLLQQPKNYQPSVKQLLIKCLSDKNHRIRHETIKILESLGYTPTTTNERIICLIAKKEWGELVKEKEAAVSPLINILEDADPKIRNTAAELLGWIGGEKVIPPLVNALQDWQIGGTAAQSLDNLGWIPTSTAERVHYLTAKKDAAALNNMWAESIAIFLSDLFSEKHFISNNAVYSLIALGNEEVIPDLINRLEENGNLSLAKDFFNSGNPHLKAAAQNWCRLNDKSVKTTTNTVKWSHWR